MSTKKAGGTSTGSTQTTFSAGGTPYSMTRIVNPNTGLDAETTMLVSGADVKRFTGEFALIIDWSEQSASCATFQGGNIGAIDEMSRAVDPAVTRAAVELVTGVTADLGVQ